VTIRSFFKWGFSSLRRQLILVSVVWSVPFFILGLVLNYSEGTLTWEWAPYLALYSLLSGLAMAVLLWFTVTLPLTRRRNGDR
jgi:hypothetical protein